MVQHGWIHKWKPHEAARGQIILPCPLDRPPIGVPPQPLRGARRMNSGARTCRRLADPPPRVRGLRASRAASWPHCIPGSVRGEFCVHGASKVPHPPAQQGITHLRAATSIASTARAEGPPPAVAEALFPSVATGNTHAVRALPCSGENTLKGSRSSHGVEFSEPACLQAVDTPRETDGE